MDLVAVIVAAAASWVLGAAWYMTLAQPWMEAAGIPRDANGKPQGNGSPLPFLLSAICMLLGAGRLRHILVSSGVAGAIPSAVTGLGVGLFFIAPWTMINNAYGMRPFKLTIIDGGYAVTGCTLIGLVLGLFGVGG